MQKNSEWIQLGQRIRKMRGTQSRREFADAFLIAQSSLARWEAGEAPPDLGFLIRIVSGYGVNFSWLITGKEDLPENGEFTADHQFKYLDKVDWTKVREDTPSPSGTLDSENIRHVADQKIQHTETTRKKNTKSATLAGDTFQSELNTLNKELRDLMRENATILRENGDLRVEIERKKARITELERELVRILKGEETSPVAGAG